MDSLTLRIVTAIVPLALLVGCYSLSVLIRHQRYRQARRRFRAVR